MPEMTLSDLTPREYWAQIKANPGRAKFGFGIRAALINVDPKRACTDVDTFATAHRTHSRA